MVELIETLTNEHLYPPLLEVPDDKPDLAKALNVIGELQKEIEFGEVIADDEATSRAVLAKARYALLHTDFDGRLCISGNLAFPFSPSDMSVGDVFDFSVWHTLELDDPLEPFPVTYQEIAS